MLLFGMHGAGKTHFIESHGAAYILNFDGREASNPRGQAMKFPVISGDSGQALDGEGREFVPSWQDFKQEIDSLLSLAKSGSERPETVVLDSIKGMTNHLVRWIPPNADKIGISSVPQNEWKDLHGPAAYDYMYTAIMNTITGLSNAGYGVWVTAHVINKVISVGERSGEEVLDVNLPEGLWKRLYGCFDIVSAIVRNQVSTTKKVETQKTVNGKTINFTRNVPVTKNQVCFSVRHDRMEGTLASRVPLPELIELPEVGGFEYLQGVYDESASKRRGVS